MKDTVNKSIPLIPRLKVLANVSKLFHNPIPLFQGYLKQHGDIVKVKGGRNPIILTTRVKVIEHVLQKNNRNYWKSKTQTETLGKYTGKGLLTINGDYWLQQRRLIQPAFNRKKLEAYMGLMQAEIDSFDPNLKRLADTNQSFDIAKTMMEIAFRVVSRCLFSKSIDETILSRNEVIIEEIMKHVTKTARLPFLKPWYFLSGQDAKIQKLKDEADGIFLDAIRKRKVTEEQHSDLLDRLLQVRYEDTGEGMTDQQVLDESLIIFAAGHETTANALSWLLHLIAQHPEVEQKVLEELDDVLAGQAPSFDDLAKLKYTSMVIHEGMRLYPPAWLTDRVALDDDEIDGYFIPKGSIVLSFIYGVHHHTDYWEDPEKFMPERFEKEQIKQRHKFAYLPFGGGPRFCIGSNFALIEMQLMLIHALSKYKWELIKEQEIDLQPLITLRPRYGIQMKISRREQTDLTSSGEVNAPSSTEGCPFH